MDKNFVIIIPSYNNARWYTENIFSILSQRYSKNNCRVIYIDDCSTDGTADLVKDIINRHKVDYITLIRNTERKGALRNFYEVIHNMTNDDDVIVTVDGDDKLSNSGVLLRLNQEYQNDNVWMTYGSYADSNGMTRGCCRPPPENIVKNCLYRQVPWFMSHLRTFYSKLFKQIKKEDLLYSDGTFYKMGWDLSFMIPMAELCGGNFSYIDDILYIYNNNNEISDHRVNQAMQGAMDGHVRGRKKYNKLEKLF